MFRIALLFALFTPLLVSPASAQRVEDAAVSIHQVFPPDTIAADEPDSGGSRPRWVKAAVWGALGGGLTFAALHWMASDFKRDFARDVMTGVVMGGVGSGAAIAFYDWVCAPDSASDRAGLCGPGF